MHILFCLSYQLILRTLKQESLRYMQQNFVSFGLSCFAR